MKRALLALLPVLVASGVAACGGAAPNAGPAANATPVASSPSPSPVASTVKVSAAGVLVSADGLTLYRFTAEAGTKIACSGACATTWPPLLVPTGDPVGSGLSAPLGTVTRPDGGRQVTYNGWPLYHFHLDVAPGDAKGQGIAGKWFSAMPGDAAA